MLSKIMCIHCLYSINIGAVYRSDLSWEQCLTELYSGCNYDHCRYYLALMGFFLHMYICDRFAKAQHNSAFMETHLLYH